MALAAAWVAIFFYLVLVPPAAHGQAKKDKDTVMGTIWAFKPVNGSEVAKGTFRISDKEVFKGSRKVGVVKPKDADETTLTISGMLEINGTIVLRKTSLKPPTWKGTLTKEDGSKWDITVDVKDRWPQRGEATWDDFLQRHAASLWQCDFFSRRVLTL